MGAGRRTADGTHRPQHARIPADAERGLPVEPCEGRGGRDPAPARGGAHGKRGAGPAAAGGDRDGGAQLARAFRAPAERQFPGAGNRSRRGHEHDVGKTFTGGRARPHGRHRGREQQRDHVRAAGRVPGALDRAGRVAVGAARGPGPAPAAVPDPDVRPRHGAAPDAGRHRHPARQPERGAAGTDAHHLLAVRGRHHPADPQRLRRGRDSLAVRQQPSRERRIRGGAAAARAAADHRVDEPAHERAGGGACGGVRRARGLRRVLRAGGLAVYRKPGLSASVRPDGAATASLLALFLFLLDFLVRFLFLCGLGRFLLRGLFRVLAFTHCFLQSN